MRRTALGSVVLGIVLPVAGAAMPAAAEAGTPGGTWIVVRLASPLPPAASERGLALTTGRAALDEAIRERGVERIECALPRALHEPRRPRALARYGLDRTYRFHLPAGADLPAAVERFSRTPGVLWAEPDGVGGGDAAVTPNDPMLAEQWGLDQASDADVDGPEGWAVETGEAILIAVLDSGADSDHPDLAGKLVPGVDTANGDDDPEDDNGHGTISASLASASTDNGEGIAGVCWGCKILPVKIWDETGTGPYSWWADGIVWAVDHGARLINISGSGAAPSQIVIDAVNYAYDAGAVVVTTSGNLAPLPVRFPGRLIETIAVGATNPQDERANPYTCNADFASGFGPELDLVAPGDDILAADLGGYTDGHCGTSLSAPLVSGLLGMVHTIDRSTGRDEARHLLRAGADDQVGVPGEDVAGFDVFHGWGRMNVERTLLAARSSASLRVEGGATTRVFLAEPNPTAQRFDFIRGELGALRETAAGVDLGPVVCLENDSPDADTAGNDDRDLPDPGQSFFYVARFQAPPGAGSYGGSSRNRDRRPRLEHPSLAWTREGQQPGEFFGQSVASAGDVNNDGFDDLLVGAYFRDGDAVDEGAVFLYLGSTSGPGSAPARVLEGGQTESWFGSAVAAAGDVNGDGFDDVIVGAPNFDDPEPNEGRAAVWLGSESGLEATPHWVVEGNQSGALFGWSVAAAGDVNADGFDDVIVAAAFYDNDQSDEGIAYVYHGSPGGLGAAPAWRFETNQPGARVSAVAGAGDVNGDGFDDVIVGADHFDGPQVDEGRVWTFHGSAGGLSPLPSRILQINLIDTGLGNALSAAGDVNGDDYGDIVVGASLFDNGHSDEGAALVYLGGPNGIGSGQSWFVEADQNRALLGSAVGSAGDVNGDGFDDVIVGASHFDLTRTDEGRVWVYLGSEAGLATIAGWTDAGNLPGSHLGVSAAGAGDVDGDTRADVVIGAELWDGPALDSGGVWLHLGPLSPPTSGDCPGASPVE